MDHSYEFITHQVNDLIEHIHNSNNPTSSLNAICEHLIERLDMSPEEKRASGISDHDYAIVARVAMSLVMNHTPNKSE